MPDQPADNTQYFMSETHQVRVANAMQRETAKLSAQADADNSFAISDSIGSLFAICAFLRGTGLKNVAITVLKQALNFTRKGSIDGRPDRGA